MSESASEVLQAYLLTLGWQTDEAAQKKMVASLDQVQERVTGLMSAIEQMTQRMVLASRRAADSLADLYWASQKTSVSAGYIRAFSFAVSQMGGSMAGASASIERFAEKLRSSPNGGGYWAMLKTMGVTAKDAEGALKQLGQAFAKMPYYRAKLFAENLGIDEDTMRAMIRGVDKFADRYYEKMRQVGLDPTVAAKNAADFRNIWQDLWGTLEVIVDKVADTLLKAFGGEFKSLNEWLLAHADEIAKAIESILKFVIALIKELAAWIEKSGGFERVLTDMTDMFTKFGNSVGGVVKQVRALYDWLKKLGEDTGITWLLNKLGYDGPANSNPGADGGGSSGKDPWYWKADRWVRGKLGMPPAANDPAAGGGGLGTRRGAGLSPGGGGGVPKYGKLTGDQKSEMAAAIRETAREIGADPSELAAVMSFETGGTMQPHKQGGDGGRYRGLIQWSPENRVKYFGSEENFYKASIGDQVRAAGRYLKDRGYKAGMPMEGLYSAILAGRAEPKYWNRTDSNGTSPRSGVASMRSSAHARALESLERRVTPVEAGMPGAPHTGQVPADMRGKTPPPLPGASPYGGLYPMEKFNAPPAPASHSFKNSSISIEQKNEFNIASTDPSAAAQEVEKRLSRTNAGLRRNLEGAAR